MPDAVNLLTSIVIDCPGIGIGADTSSVQSIKPINMITAKRRWLKEAITKILIDDNVGIFDDNKGTCRSPDQIVDLYDELLYEHAGKHKYVSYEACRMIFKEWHTHPRLFTLQELSEEYKVPLSTVHKITAGEFWPM